MEVPVASRTHLLAVELDQYFWKRSQDGNSIRCLQKSCASKTVKRTAGKPLAYNMWIHLKTMHMEMYRSTTAYRTLRNDDGSAKDINVSLVFNAKL